MLYSDERTSFECFELLNEHNNKMNDRNDPVLQGRRSVSRGSGWRVASPS